MHDTRPSNRFRTGLIIFLAVLIAIANALVSALLVVLAIPGSGNPGAGFMIISSTFVALNVLLLAWALWASRSLRRRTQIIGLLLQLMTIPICLGVAMLVMQILGVSDL